MAAFSTLVGEATAILPNITCTIRNAVTVRATAHGQAQGALIAEKLAQQVSPNIWYAYVDIFLFWNVWGGAFQDPATAYGIDTAVKDNYCMAINDNLEAVVGLGLDTAPYDICQYNAQVG